VGETFQVLTKRSARLPFSILERIDVGETTLPSVLSATDERDFQYPRTDRRG